MLWWADHLGILKGTVDGSKVWRSCEAGKGERARAVTASCFSGECESIESWESEITIGRRDGAIEAHSAPPRVELRIPQKAPAIQKPLRACRMPGGRVIHTSVVNQRRFLRDAKNSPEQLGRREDYCQGQDLSVAPRIPSDTETVPRRIVAVTSEGYVAVLEWEGVWSSAPSSPSSPSENGCRSVESVSESKKGDENNGDGGDAEDKGQLLEVVELEENLFTELVKAEKFKSRKERRKLENTAKEKNVCVAGDTNSKGVAPSFVIAAFRIEGPISAVAVHELTPRFLAFGGKNNDVKVLDLETKSIVWRARNLPNDTLDLPVPVHVRSLLFLGRGPLHLLRESGSSGIDSCTDNGSRKSSSGEGRLDGVIACGAFNGELRLYDMKNKDNRPLHILQATNDNAPAIAMCTLPVVRVRRQTPPQEQQEPESLENGIGEVVAKLDAENERDGLPLVRSRIADQEAEEAEYAEQRRLGYRKWARMKEMERRRNVYLAKQKEELKEEAGKKDVKKARKADDKREVAGETRTTFDGDADKKGEGQTTTANGGNTDDDGENDDDEDDVAMEEVEEEELMDSDDDKGGDDDDHEDGDDDGDGDNGDDDGDDDGDDGDDDDDDGDDGDDDGDDDDDDGDDDDDDGDDGDHGCEAGSLEVVIRDPASFRDRRDDIFQVLVVADNKGALERVDVRPLSDSLVDAKERQLAMRRASMRKAQLVVPFGLEEEMEVCTGKERAKRLAATTRVYKKGDVKFGGHHYEVVYRKQFRGAVGAVTAMALDSSGNWLVSCSAQRCLLVFNVNQPDHCHKVYVKQMPTSILISSVAKIANVIEGDKEEKRRQRQQVFLRKHEKRDEFRERVLHPRLAASGKTPTVIAPAR